MDVTGEWFYVEYRFGDLDHNDTVSYVQLD